MADIPLDPLGPDRGRGDDEHETSFGGDDWIREGEQYKFPNSHHENQSYEPDESSPLLNKIEADNDEVESTLKHIFVDPKLENVLYGLDDKTYRVWVKLKGSGKVKYFLNFSTNEFRNERGKGLPKALSEYLQSWPKLCGTSLQNALPRPSISFSHGNKRSLGQILPSPPPPTQCCS